MEVATLDQNEYKKELNRIRAVGTRLGICIVILASVLYAFFVLSAAWFQEARESRAIGMNTQVIADSNKTFKLYEWVGTDETTGAWVEIASINFTDAVPNEVRRYMVIADSGSINFTQFSFAQQVVVGDNPDNEELLDYVYITKISESTNNVSVNALTNVVTYDYDTDDSSYFSYADVTAINDVNEQIIGGKYSMASSSRAVVFDIYLSKNVCNTFSLWNFTASVNIR